MRFIVCGNVVHDVVARPVEEPLGWGKTTIVEHIGQHLGGNASSTSYTLGKLGCAVRVKSLVGRDDSAGFILERLHAAGVDTSLVEYVDAPTSQALSLVNRRGERALLYRLGASAEAFQEPLTIPQDATHLHLAAVFRMRYLRARAPELLCRAKAQGLSTSVDTQWDTEGGWMRVLAPSLPFTDLLFVNEDEARMLSGSSDPARAAIFLLTAGARRVVVKLGPEGCLVDGQHVPGYRVNAVDTTGAGDTFCGGYLAALARGFDSLAAARVANAVGALSVQRAGAVEGLRDWDDTLRAFNG